ncbi:MAG: selenide, water dikinase SelD [Bacteroidota bacterium]|nr:selenide, water dikinase SelD [Bacteroidota bacterium]
MNIYLDYNATTPIDKEVAEEMKPYLEKYFGNPSSSHSYGIETKKTVEKARKQIAKLINCKTNEIIFTSGGTESNNYAIKGIAYKNEAKGKHIITSTIEHPAVLEVCKYLETKGFNISYISVNENGIINITELEEAITPETILISIMHANNEIGSIQPIKKISTIAKKHNIIFHTDAAQSIGKHPADVQELGVDLLSIAGHKLYAPKGIGALYIREGIQLEKLMHGANHELNKRAGTENILEISGLGKACEIAQRDLEKNMSHMKEMRDLLNNKLLENWSEIKLNGHKDKRLANTLNISFPHIEANILLNELEANGIAASAGAACHTDSIDVSSVLTAIKLNMDYSMGTIRFSTGRHTTKEEILNATKIINETVNKLRPSVDNSPIKQIENNMEIKLTKYTQGGGCACKIKPQYLEKILVDLPIPLDKNILIGTETADDAAVYKLNEETALVQTLDFFTPIVDDPYEFGAIAATNALSDIYAMGAKPIFGLNIVGFPSNRLPMDVLKQILKGAQDKATEAGISILGGHSIEDPEPKYGMVVSGIVHPDKILSNANAKEGDAIILTKPIGVGIISSAIKKGLVDTKTKDYATKLMTTLNKTASEVLSKYNVNACTDVTGFGLLGHLKEITKGSNVNAEVFFNSIPVIPEAIDFVAANIYPAGSKNNLDYLHDYLIWDNNIDETSKILLCDAQTAGGFVFTVPFDEKDKIIAELKENNILEASYIGNITNNGKGNISIIKKN